MSAAAIHTPEAPAAIGPYSQGVQAAGLVFVSGQLPIDPAAGRITAVDAAGQADQSLRNLAAILGEAGLGLADVVKTTVLLANIADFDEVNAVYSAWFTGPVLPARSAFAVVDLPKGALVEIEAIAARS